MPNKTKLAVGLDLGATSTRAIICALENDSIHFLGYGEAPVHAWSKGRLSDQGALTESIRFAFHEAELRARSRPNPLSSVLADASMVLTAVASMNLDAVVKLNLAIYATPSNLPPEFASKKIAICFRSAHKTSLSTAAPVTAIRKALHALGWKRTFM